jgi:O-antigen ligase
MYTATNEQPETARRWLKVLLASTLIEALLTMIFRVAPAIEMAFLRSPVARPFISASALQAFFTVMPDNVIDPAKAGGFFLNGNVAAIFLGVSGLAAWHFGTECRSRLLRLVGMVDLLAVFFTGSKAGAIFALAVPSTIWLATAITAKHFKLQHVALVALALGALPAALAIAWSHLGVERFQQNAADALHSREVIWGFARIAFPSHPLLGLGYGGWEKAFPIYGFKHGVSTALPPHNSALIMWAQSGFFAVLAGVAWFVFVGLAVARAFTINAETRQLALGVGGAFLWYVCHGMSENIGWVGETRLTPLLGVLLGYMCARCDHVVQRAGGADGSR